MKKTLALTPFMMSKPFTKALFAALLLATNLFAQERIPLYATTIPNAKNTPNLETSKANAEVDTLTFNVSIPSLSIYLPSNKKSNGTAVLIFPGGGYGVLLTKREGSDIARAFTSLGITAFVVKYRLPSNITMIDPTIGPLQDAQQAIKIVRQNAKKWNVDPQKIGVVGFSAGGHVAASLGTHFEQPYIANEEKINLRPDFMVLVNPVISFNKQIGHMGSKNKLLGPKASQEQIDFFSNELQVKSSTPTTWLVHSANDKVVPAANSLAFFNALIANGVPAEIHIYEKGEHGFLTAPSFKEWFGRCLNWLVDKKLLETETQNR